MACKVYAPPIELLPVPELDIKEPVRDFFAAEKAWVERLQDWCRQRSKGDIVGEVIRFPVGDGHATYVVYRQRPLEIIHVPIGDAWNFQQAHLLTVTEIRNMAKREKAMARLFGGGGVIGIWRAHRKKTKRFAGWQ